MLRTDDNSSANPLPYCIAVVIFKSNAMKCDCADVVNPDSIHLKRGDKVQVDVDIDTFKKVQKEHQSGWNDAMKQVNLTLKYHETDNFHSDIHTVTQLVLIATFIHDTGNSHTNAHTMTHSQHETGHSTLES